MIENINQTSRGRMLHKQNSSMRRKEIIGKILSLSDSELELVIARVDVSLNQELTQERQVVHRPSA